MQILSQLVNGVAIGSVYAIVALGFTIVFGVAKVVNFAQGSQVVMSAYVAWAAVQAGAPLWAAFLISVVASVLLAWFIDLIAVEWLGKAAEIAPLLSTMALAYIIDQGVALIWTPDPQPFPNPMAGEQVTFGGMYFSATDATILGVSVVTMAGVALFLRRAWLGRAIRATAQDPVAAEQMGVNPRVTRLAAFALAGIVGAVGGVLVGMYFQQINPYLGLPLGLKGFAAAMVGGITSLVGAVVGGIVIGVFEALSSGFIGPEYRDLVAYGLLLVILLARPSGLFGSKALRGLGGERGAGAIPTTSLLANSVGEPVMVAGLRKLKMRWSYAAVAVIMLACLIIPSPYWVSVLAQVSIFATGALALTLLTGQAGQVSIGHAAVMGVGAYAAARLTLDQGWPLALIVLAVIGSGALAGLFMALPVLRLSGHTGALATLAVGQIGYLAFLNAMPITRGSLGISGISAPPILLIGGQEVDAVLAMGLLCAVMLALSLLIYQVIARGRLGIQLRAIREDRLAASSTGIRVTWTLALAYAVSGIIAGLAGMMFAYQQTFISPDSFKVQLSLLLLTMILVGGITSPLGAIVGAAVLTILPEVLREIADYRMIVYGVIMLVMVKYLPAGLVHLPRWRRSERVAPAAESGPSARTGAGYDGPTDPDSLAAAVRLDGDDVIPAVDPAEERQGVLVNAAH